MPTDISSAVDMVKEGGVVFLLILFIVGVFKEWIVMGRAHDREVATLRNQVAFWRDVSIRQMDQTGRAIEVVEKTVP